MNELGIYLIKIKWFEKDLTLHRNQQEHISRF